MDRSERFDEPTLAQRRSAVRQMEHGASVDRFEALDAGISKRREFQHNFEALGSSTL